MFRIIDDRNRDRKGADNQLTVQLVPKRRVRAGADLNPRYFRAGMWAYLLHRGSGLAILLFLLMHIWEITAVNRGGSGGFDATMAATMKPVLAVGEWLLFLALTYHGINGIRLMLHDLGHGVRLQRKYFWAVLALCALVIIPGSWAFAARLFSYLGV